MYVDECDDILSYNNKEKKGEKRKKNIFKKHLRTWTNGRAATGINKCKVEDDDNEGS